MVLLQLIEFLNQIVDLLSACVRNYKLGGEYMNHCGVIYLLFLPFILYYILYLILFILEINYYLIELNYYIEFN